MNNTPLQSQSLRIIGLLLTYPQPELVAAGDELLGLLSRESWLPAPQRKAVSQLLAQMQTQDILDLQETYVDLFDRTPSLSLHLFEHVHGDSRDRGQALVDLDMAYREQGLHNTSDHTPDYLPMFLEYLSLLPVPTAREQLAGALEVIAAIGARLKKRNSPYACLFDALEVAAGCKPDSTRLQAALLADAGDRLTPEQLDSAWEEQFALAAPSTHDSCPKAEQILARMHAGLAETGVQP